MAAAIISYARRARMCRSVRLRPCLRALSGLSTSAASPSTAASQSTAHGRARIGDLDKFDLTKEAQEQQDFVEEEDEMFEDPRERILDAALLHVQRDGWSMDAVAAGANDLGYPSVSAGMFERGAVELVWHVVRKANTHMSESLESMDLASIPVNERVKAGVQARLTYLARYHKAWPQAMALALQPAALPETLQLLAVAADEIWYWAGDRSTDLNWYTRRLLLMGVMATTETAMLTDRTPGHVETWEFLDRRLQDVSQFGRSVGDSLSMLAAAAGGLGSLANAAFDIIRPVIVRDGPLPTGPVPRGAAAYGAGAGASAGVHSGSQARPASPAWPAGLPASPAEGVAQAAAAAASVAQAVASQAATVAAATGVRLPDPSVVLGALSTFLPRPPRGGIPPPTGFASRGPGAPGAAPPGPVFPHATGGGVTEPVTFPSPPGTGTPNGPVQV